MATRFVSRLAGAVALLAMLLGSGVAVSAAGVRSYSQSTTVTFTPQADAAVKSAFPATNFGTDTILRARTSPTVRSYLRFEVAGLNGAGVLGASLRLYTRSSSSQVVKAKTVASDTWHETTITYNTAPAVGVLLGSTPASFASGQWVTIDVSSYVRQAGVYSFVLTTPNTNPVDFASRETGSTAPQLVLTLGSAVSPTTTPTATPTATADWQPSFPIRAAFYYPWFPEAWKQSGMDPFTHYQPTAGFYSQDDAAVIQAQISAMQYGKIEAGISSWWGQGTPTDKRFPFLLAEGEKTGFYWAAYYEQEGYQDPPVTAIQSDLAYLQKQYASSKAYLKVDGRMVVFVYADSNDRCSMVDRWVKANTVNAYLVLKVFPGYHSCTSQPDGWHQYAPATAEKPVGKSSFTISPGFWKAGVSQPDLPRDLQRWNSDIRAMMASDAPWQLVTTFNEWGEGTAVEGAQEWQSPSGYGLYLDALHNDGKTP